MLKAKAGFYIISVLSTSAIFLFRVRALFWGDPWITQSFTLSLLAVLGGCATAFFSSNVERIGHAATCRVTSMGRLCSGCTLSLMIYDTTILVFMSWRLLSMVTEEVGLISKLEYFWGKRTLPVISEALLRNGQQYYLCVSRFSYLLALALGNILTNI